MGRQKPSKKRSTRGNRKEFSKEQVTPENASHITRVVWKGRNREKKGGREGKEKHQEIHYGDLQGSALREKPPGRG